MQKENSVTCFLRKLRKKREFSHLLFNVYLITKQAQKETALRRFRNKFWQFQIEPNYERMAVKVCDDERVIAYVPDYRLSTVDPSKPFRPPCDYVELVQYEDESIIISPFES